MIKNQLLLWQPKIKSTVYSNDLLLDKEGKGPWVIGDSSVDTQFTIPAYQKFFFDNVCQHLNGKNTIEDIAKLLETETKKILSIVKVLYYKGMLTESNESNIERLSEVDRYAIPIIKYNFKGIKNTLITQRIAQFMVWFSHIACIALALSIIFLLRNHTGHEAWMDLLSYGDDESGYFKGYILSNVGMIFMFFLHELGHVVLGLKHKIQPAKFSFVLFLGFLPMFYIKNKNMYSLKKKQMIGVLLAGVYMNMFLALLYANLYLIFDHDFFKLMVVSNIRIILINVWPLALTDGYFILSVISKKVNLRYKLHCAIAEPKRMLKYTLIEKLFALAAFSILIFTMGVELLWIISLFQLDSQTSMMILGVLLLIYLCVLNMIEKRVIRKEGQVAWKN